jgi:hypothetical protein
MTDVRFLFQDLSFAKIEKRNSYRQIYQKNKLIQFFKTADLLFTKLAEAEFINCMNFWRGPNTSRNYRLTVCYFHARKYSRPCLSETVSCSHLKQKFPCKYIRKDDCDCFAVAGLVSLWGSGSLLGQNQAF